MLYRSGGELLAGHLEATYGVTVTVTRELDLGVHRVDLAGGARWIARIFPAARDVEAVRLDAQLRAIARAAVGFHGPAPLIALGMLALGGLRPNLPGR